MAIGAPDRLSGLRIGGTDMGTSAPEVWEGGTHRALKAWYWDNQPATIQRGRTSPKPVKMSFTLVGPTALNNALFLDGLSKNKDGPVSVVWGDISFSAEIEDVDYKAQFDRVEVDISFLPVDDPNPTGQLFIPDADEDPLKLLGDALSDLTDLADAVNQVGKFFDNALQGVRDAIDAAESVIDTVTSTLATVQSIANFPANLAAEVTADATDAIGQLTEAAASIVQTANAATQLPAEIAADVSQIAQACHASAERLLYVTQLVTPPTTGYTVIEGDTLSDIADTFSVAVSDIIALNPDLARSALVPGQVIVIPQ